MSPDTDQRETEMNIFIHGVHQSTNTIRADVWIFFRSSLIRLHLFKMHFIKKNWGQYVICEYMLRLQQSLQPDRSRCVDYKCTELLILAHHSVCFFFRNGKV